MLFNVSYTNDEVDQEIRTLVGSPFSLWRRFKMGSIGSQRFQVQEASQELKTILVPHQRTAYCNIGLRPRGIQIWLPIKLHTYLLALPYKDLQINVKGDDLWLVRNPYSLKLSPAHNAQLNHVFVEKMRYLQAQ